MSRASSPVQQSRSQFGDQPYVQNRGDLILFDSAGGIIAGNSYSLDLASAEMILPVIADHLPPSMPLSLKRMVRK